MLQLCLAVIFLVFIYINIIFLISWYYQRLDIVDIAWSGGFIVIALSTFLFGSHGLLQAILSILVIIWGFRLSYSIFRRVIGSSKVDSRYKKMKDKILTSYFQIFLVQGFLTLIVALPIFVINFSAHTRVGLVCWLGVAVWFCGFLFETISDYQLRKFLSLPAHRGKLMVQGLWQYTRHPNYFGEVMQWWGIFLISLSIPLGYFCVISPLTITFLILFVSGIPLTEARLKGRRGWKKYKRQTSMFLPLLPKR